ncbi:MAG: polysaccharide biosynthesis/export family protein [Gemmatimonadota bacterium]
MRINPITALCLVSLSLFSAPRAAAQRTSDASFAASRAGVGPVSPNSAHPGDILRLRIWREPDMSGDFPVDAEGTATLPRLGAMRVVDIPRDSLQRLLVAEYARFLRNPSVEVTLLRRVRVVGEVRTPGLYTADPTMGLRDILALAGGPNPDGRTDRVRLDRGGESTWLTLTGAPPTDESRPRSGDQLFVPQRNWFARNTPIVATVASVTGALLIALSTR